jgi:hypothetical protein
MARWPAPNIIPSARYKLGVAESIEQLSFELTANALAEQERAVAELRARAGTVLAAASIAGSFLATKTGHGSLGFVGVSAMVGFVLCVGTCVSVLLPHQLAFVIHGEGLDRGKLGLLDVTQAYRAARKGIEPQLRINSDEIARLSDRVAVGCLLLAIELVLWTISIIVS